MSLRTIIIQYLGDTLYLPPLEREVNHIIIREDGVKDWVGYEPVVRCNDCKHFGFFDDSEEKDYCGYWGSLAIDPDDFCKWGERKEVVK